MKPEVLVFYRYRPTVKPQYQGKFCWDPYTTVEIDEDGDVMLCGCQFHMPYVVGNIYNQSLEDIWHGAEAKKVRQSVLDGEFTYCNWACPKLNHLESTPAALPLAPDFPSIVKIDLDRSCNLKCPSCRESVIQEKNNIDVIIPLSNAYIFDLGNASLNLLHSISMSAHPISNITPSSGIYFFSHSVLIIQTP